ncbi:Polysaccharide deacetylase [Marinobacter gudaonensis]|uniref:Polysaccharide deacetylase n=1 Tax=Marinobacter gudaonensis TaxID=375760 RepID=A0A1I6GDL6_9GAMM|nr:polysaccharide deacetylase family protein [Marinobacter gudaonensis]SFR40276.1 Polysaccharide deacetylase [Marinobacter gudaonensis]
MGLSPFVRLAGQFGGYRLAQFLTASQPRILMYHRFSKFPAKGHVSSEVFENQVAFIAKHYNPMTVSELVAALYEGEGTPKHAVAITVDDGYRDFYEVAWPILKRHGVPATFYVTTGFVDQRLWLWPDQLRWLLEKSAPNGGYIKFNGRNVLTSGDSGELEKLFGELVQHLLTLPDAKKHEFIENLSASWDVDLPEQSPEAFQAATWKQLEEMQDGGIEIGGHTVTHPSLGRVDSEQAEMEISGCYQEINDHLGWAPRSFCYPNGTPSDFVGAHVPIIKRVGFSGAVVAYADAQGQAQRYALRRHSGSDDMFQFNKAISGLELLGKRLRNETFKTLYD